jgi:hypothetical protein
MQQTAAIRAELAARYEQLAHNGSDVLTEEQREHYHERARRLTALSQRAQRFAQRERSRLTSS